MLTQEQMNRLPSFVRPLSLGLLIAQFLGTVQVYLSNNDLYRTLVVMRNAGYFVIPNQKIMPSLQALGPAFCGGLFFAFSVGGGLSLLSVAAAWVWDRLFSRRIASLFILLTLWMGLLVLVNIRGLCLMESLYFLLLPPAVFVSMLRWMPPPAGQKVWLHRMVHAAPIVILALIWASQMNRQLFVNVRDRLLLCNPVGIAINDFYYDYTLYAAEVFKTLEQKLLKTCDLQSIRTKSLLTSLERALLGHDYLPVQGERLVDLRISSEDDLLVLASDHRALLRIPFRDFLVKPGEALKAFSRQNDRQSFFRGFTYYSLLLGFPLTLYLLLYALFRLLLCLFLNINASSFLASTLCFFIGCGIFLVFAGGTEEKIEVKDVAKALESDHWQERVAGLKAIEQKWLELGSFQVYERLLQSPYIPERYWLLRAMSVSRSPETYNHLLAFLDDPHPNVVSMAFYGLGRRGDRRAVNQILKKIARSDHWYSQWYGYKALRDLGWKQSKSQ